MRVLVTGGAGFIGSHLVERLVREGHKVAVVDDFSNGRIENLKAVLHKVTLIVFDMSSRLPALSSLLPAGIDAVFHLACHPRSLSFDNPRRDVEVNVIGTVNVIRYALATKAKIIFSSNSGIYDTSELPISEETADNPKTPYDLDKLLAENYLRLYHSLFSIPLVIFRFATVYGPRQLVSNRWRPVVMEFAEKLASNLRPTIFGDGSQTRDFIYVDDVVSALVKALGQDVPSGETLILGTGTETSIKSLYEMVREAAGRVGVEPVWGEEPLGEIRRMRYDCSKARRLLGWRPETSIREGVEKVVGSVKHEKA